MILIFYKNLETIGTLANILGVLVGVVTALITLAALAFTIYFSWQNRQMLIESRKSRLVFSIKLHQNSCYAVEMKNVGYYPAQKIHLKFNDEFLQNCVPVPEHRELYSLMSSRGFSLNGGDSQLLYINTKSDSNRKILS